MCIDGAAELSPARVLAAHLSQGSGRKGRARVATSQGCVTVSVYACRAKSGKLEPLPEGAG